MGAAAGVVLVNFVPYVVPGPFPLVAGSIVWSLVVLGVEMLVIGAVVTLGRRRFNTLRFEPHQLVVTRLLWPRHRVVWSQVVSAELVEVSGGAHRGHAYRQLVLGLRRVQDTHPGGHDRVLWTGFGGGTRFTGT